jgi:chromosome segregation ATPase
MQFGTFDPEMLVDKAAAAGAQNSLGAYASALETALEQARQQAATAELTASSLRRQLNAETVARKRAEALTGEVVANSSAVAVRRSKEEVQLKARALAAEEAREAARAEAAAARAEAAAASAAVDARVDAGEAALRHELAAAQAAAAALRAELATEKSVAAAVQSATAALEGRVKEANKVASRLRQSLNAAEKEASDSKALQAALVTKLDALQDGGKGREEEMSALRRANVILTKNAFAVKRACELMDNKYLDMTLLPASLHATREFLHVKMMHLRMALHHDDLEEVRVTVKAYFDEEQLRQHVEERVEVAYADTKEVLRQWVAEHGGSCMQPDDVMESLVQRFGVGRGD